MTKQSGLQDILPLAPLQEGLLFHSVFDEKAPDVYLVQQAIDLEGDLDTAALAAACRTLLRRHANLRAAFRYQGLKRPVQLIPHQVELPWEETDLSRLPEPERSAAADRLLEEDRLRRFDLGRPPLMRFTLMRLGDSRYRFVLTNHHILLDGWSRPMLVRELLALYRTKGDDSALPLVSAPSVTTSSGSPGRTGTVRSPPGGRCSPDWTGPPSSAAQAGDRTPVVPGRLETELAEADHSALTRLARERSLTLNSLVQGAWAVVLSGLTGRDDVVFGTTVSGRPPEVAGIETMVGMFINTLPVRVRLRPDEPFLDAVRRTQDEQDPAPVAPATGPGRGAAAGGRGRTLRHHHGVRELSGRHRCRAGRARRHRRGRPSPATRNRDATHYPLALVAVGRDGLRLRLDHQPDLVPPKAARGRPGAVGARPARGGRRAAPHRRTA
ncbi:Amino acid adenylation domain-containing protein OS=Streptomyces tendae OX=1932 GN=GUR47_35325 PE=4 SV=1 [Streptomyces tendae]